MEYIKIFTSLVAAGILSASACGGSSGPKETLDNGDPVEDSDKTESAPTPTTPPAKQTPGTEDDDPDPADDDNDEFEDDDDDDDDIDDTPPDTP